MSNVTATCLCGAVKITAEQVDPKFTVCHCHTCRTWGGGPLFAMRCGVNIVFEHEHKISQYASSSWASRGFCSECGTHLFYRLNQTGEYNVPVGLFAHLTELEFEMAIQYFSDARPSYYCFSNQTKEMTTEQIMAYFASQRDR
ncbi:GFA family protein [Shewanella sp. NIFS-20-20]|uniref:GFA family protein n=1 Tax=Shewanella sp. NIFS-20-20 TaxID=2853806 RepID=UPI001C43AAF5|nr:GFA family protein [Shewanella sp. NIFS-20-20]MBV7315118.1 GFA family protein [Shewanella sp. NIFS-20-20]